MVLNGIFEVKHCVVDGDFVFIFGEMLILGVVRVLAFLSINLAQLFMTTLMILRRNSVRQRGFKWWMWSEKNAPFGASLLESRRSNQVDL
ncbi:hypothetical protein AKJ31_12105 [Vibrio hepatarius]|uniref:Transmembrane protein n=1 Tax=Vibrio hepatarius TaxID=171383 RepID=A0A0M0HZW7_9VIBR|nr:hypothetical protein AKJ31_12105 [Vibrio hepatarius]